MPEELKMDIQKDYMTIGWGKEGSTEEVFPVSTNCSKNERAKTKQEDTEAETIGGEG